MDSMAGQGGNGVEVESCQLRSFSFGPLILQDHMIVLELAWQLKGCFRAHDLSENITCTNIQERHSGWCPLAPLDKARPQMAGNRTPTRKRDGQVGWMRASV